MITLSNYVKACFLKNLIHADWLETFWVAGIPFLDNGWKRETVLGIDTGRFRLSTEF